MYLKRLLTVAALLLLVPLLMGALVTRSDAHNGCPIDDDLTSGTKALGTSSASYTLPVPEDSYMVCANGNTAYVTCGSSPTAATGAGNYTFFVPEGTCIGPMSLHGPKCAYIASSAAGEIVFVHFDPDL